LETGLSFNILASAKEYFYDELVVGKTAENKFYRFNLEWVGGIGYRFHEHWGGGFRYTYSVSPIGTAKK